MVSAIFPHQLIKLFSDLNFKVITIVMVAIHIIFLYNLAFVVLGKYMEANYYNTLTTYYSHNGDFFKYSHVKCHHNKFDLIDLQLKKQPYIFKQNVVEQVLALQNQREDGTIPRFKREDEENPCTPRSNNLPEFRAPGRRVSERKCLQNIIRIKRWHEEDEREIACLDYMIRRNERPQIWHAVIGGRFTQNSEFPHMGAIGWKAAGNGTYIFKCGCTLISPKFALTAAHCSKTSSRDRTVADTVPKIVRMADKNILDSQEYEYAFRRSRDYEIERIIVHPQYKAPNKYYDIALIEFSKSVPFMKEVQPACLWSKPHTNFSGPAIVTGWGVVATGDLTISPELMAAEVDVVDTDSCNNLLRGLCTKKFCGVRDHQLCAGKLAGGVDTCQGDSGGPLQVKIDLPIKHYGTLSYVVGVTSLGKKCAMKNSPGVYTRVSSFLDWIEPIVWPGEY